MVALNFNAAAVRPNIALEALPSGLYPVMITASVEKPTKNGQGAYLEIEMTVMPGHEFGGRKVYDRLNIKNANQQTVDIAYGTLSSICHVTGRLNMTDTQQLHGIPFQVVVVKVPRDDRPDQMTNNIRGYKDMQGNDPGTAGQVQQPAAQPTWANGGAGANAPAPVAPIQQQAPQVQQPPAQQYAPPATQPAFQPQQTQPVQPVQQPQQPAPQQEQPAWAQPGANGAVATETPPWAGGQ